MRKSLREFIKENKQDIDGAIKRRMCRADVSLNDSERRAWVLNDEVLYNWARSEGVRI